MHLRRNVPIISVLLGLLASLVAVTPAARAEESPWPRAASQQHMRLQSAPDGGVVEACSGGASPGKPVATRLSPVGVQLATVYAPADQLYAYRTCGSSQITKAGLIVSQGRTDSNTTETVVRASGPGGVVWSHRVVGCNGVDAPLYSNAEYAPAMDVVFYTTYANCDGLQLLTVALSASTGQVKFRVPMGNLPTHTSVKSYNDGFVYYDSSNGKFVYLDNRGRRDDTKTVTVDGAYSWAWAVGAKGDLAAVTTQKWHFWCMQERILTFRSVSGVVTTRTLPNLPACGEVAQFAITPDGSAAFYDAMADARMLRIVSASVSKPAVEVPFGNMGANNSQPHTMLADSNGHIVLHFDYQIDGKRHVMVRMYNMTGTLKQSFTTESFGSLDTFWSNQSAMALTQGYVYLSVMRGDADRNVTSTIHKIPLTGAGMDYPRSALFGAKPSLPVYNYVAMGDSFSSGEGVEPFEAGTAVKGKNECHRSKYAYPRLLGSVSGLRLNLGAKGFAACSGATTKAITEDGYNGESAQRAKLVTSTDLVTLTIGGNNVPFEDFAAACAMPRGSSCDGLPLKKALNGIATNTTPGVATALAALNEQLSNADSRAIVLVVGYPHMVPEKWVYESAGCWWLQPKELTAIRKLTDALNAAIKKQVDKFGGRFKFVSATERTSPFRGHELCRSTKDKVPRYFNNVNLNKPQSYTFHPNKDGQAAYAKLIAAAVVKYGLAA